MSVQERKYMSREDEQSLFPEPVIQPPVTVESDNSTPVAKSLRAATTAVEAEIKKLKQVIKERNEQLATLKTTAQGLMVANLEKPEAWPVVETVCTMLCGLVYCRPIDEADRLRIVTAADKGHALLDQIAGAHVNFPAAKLMSDAALREFYDFANRTKKEQHEKAVDCK